MASSARLMMTNTAKLQAPVTETFLDAILSLPAIYPYLLQVSPDGKWVAWSWYGIRNVADVYVAPTDGSAAPLQLSETDEHTLVISWTHDSRALIVAQDADGDERYQLFRIDLERQCVLVPLTEPDPAFFLRGGDLHPNGRWLVYGANFDFERAQEIEPTWVYRHDLQTGERRVLARPRKAGFVLPHLSPTGEYMVYNRTDEHPAGRQTWLVDIHGKHDREILNFGPQVKTYAGWFPDGRRLVVLSDRPTYTRLGVFDLVTNELRWLIDDPLRAIEEAFVPYGSRDIVIVERQDARTHVSLLNPDTQREEHLPEIPGELLLLAPVGAREWVAHYSSSRQPDDIVRLSLDDLDPSHFTSLTRVWERTPLTPNDLTPAEDFRWTSVDGMPMQGWLYRARGKPHGMIVFVHGGPTYHSPDWINATIQYLAQQGFNVFDPNYRGSTGFGVAFREAIKQEGWGGSEQEDIRTGIEALIAAGIAERGKIGITGTSYGGYSSWFALTHFPPELIAAAVPICGMTDLVVDYETTRPDLRPYSEEMMGGSPFQVPQRYYERSPINFIENIRAPLLIVQGMQDPNVTPENVRVVTARLQDHGIEYQLLAFENEGHGIARRENRKTLLGHMVPFFASAFNHKV